MERCGSIGYGMIATAYVAQNCNEGRVRVKRIAGEFNIPMAYLQKIMGRLVKANILQGKRGPHGGFTLARPAAEISLLEIWEVIDGRLGGHVEISRQTNKEPFVIAMEKVCRQGADKARAVLANCVF